MEEGPTTVLVAYPRPQRSDQNESVNSGWLLYFTERSYLLHSNHLHYGKNSLWTINILSRTSSRLKEKLPWLSGRRSDGRSTQPHVSSCPDVTEGASCRPGVCSPPDAGVWAVPQVRLKLTFGNIYQDRVYRQLKEKSTFILRMFSVLRWLYLCHCISNDLY